MIEEWRKIKDFEDYEVSNLGNVRSLKNGKVRMRKCVLNENGYVTIQLFKNAKNYDYKVHRLVALAFIPNPDNKEQVNHIDGNKQNNCIINLEWCTRSENEIHSFRVLKQSHNMRGKFGKESIHARKVAQVDINTGKIIKMFYGAEEAERETKIKATNIRKVCYGNSTRVKAGGYGWKYI